LVAGHTVKETGHCITSIFANHARHGYKLGINIFCRGTLGYLERMFKHRAHQFALLPVLRWFVLVHQRITELSTVVFCFCYPLPGTSWNARHLKNQFITKFLSDSTTWFSLPSAGFLVLPFPSTSHGLKKLPAESTESKLVDFGIRYIIFCVSWTNSWNDLFLLSVFNCILNHQFLVQDLLSDLLL
jgi:hypothetical protein